MHIYQQFRCRTRNAFIYELWYLYRLTVTGRDRFAMEELASGYGG